MALPTVYMLTCPPRTAMAEATLQRWERTDWCASPQVILDAEPDVAGEEWGTAGRGPRMVALFKEVLTQALDDGGEEDDWILFLEDDLDFHPRIGTLVESWRALEDSQCVMASLFNPGLRPADALGSMERAFAANPKTLLGAQALFLRRGAVARALAKWKTVTGLQAQRLARLLGEEGPIWVHQPSLVQHVAEDSSWGGPVQRALDFDAAWEI